MSKINNSKDFRKQVNELLVSLNINEEILKLAEKAYNSGGMDTEDIDSNDFRLAKAALCAIFNKLSIQLTPFGADTRSTAENLKKII
jgi:hypothetical protein